MNNDQEYEVLADEGLGRGSVWWNADLTRGYSDINSGICASLTVIENGSVGPFEVALPDADRPLGADWEIDHCSDDLRAGHPSLSPDGRTLAFFASPSSPDASGQDRLDVPWNLYVADAAGGGTARLLTEGIYHPRSTDWSPDSAKIVFLSESDSSVGLLVTDVASRETVRLTENPYTWVTWSPGGKSLIAVAEPNDDETTDIVSLELPIDLRAQRAP